MKFEEALAKLEEARTEATRLRANPETKRSVDMDEAWAPVASFRLRDFLDDCYPALVDVVQAARAQQDEGGQWADDAIKNAVEALDRRCAEVFRQ